MPLYKKYPVSSKDISLEETEQFMKRYGT